MMDDDDDLDLDVEGLDSTQYREIEIREQDRFLPVANIARIMKKVLPANAKITKDSKEAIQECVSEFISFITSEASDKCQQEKRKTINGDDLLWAMSTLGFEKYVEPLKMYLSKYRDAVKGDKPEKKSVTTPNTYSSSSIRQNSHSTISSSSSSIGKHQREDDNDHHHRAIRQIKEGPLEGPHKLASYIFQGVAYKFPTPNEVIPYQYATGTDGIDYKFGTSTKSVTFSYATQPGNTSGLALLFVTEKKKETLQYAIPVECIPSDGIDYMVYASVMSEPEFMDLHKNKESLDAAVAVALQNCVPLSASVATIPAIPKAIKIELSDK